MEALMEILEDVNEGIDWAHETKLIDDRIIDSLTVISMIADLEEAFQIVIRAEEITRDNFNSVESIWNMICRLREN